MPIKRVKLIVRKPPPLISNPHQRPPTAKFDGSLEKLIPTFSHWEDERVDPATLELRIREEAELRKRAAKLRKEGRFYGFVDANTAGGSSMSMSRPTSCSDAGIDLQRVAYQGRNPDSKDVWDHLLEDVAQHDSMRKKRPTGPAVAAAVASKVKAYWEAQAAKQDKAKAQEEKRLRALAKATMKLVIAEWRKGVFVSVDFPLLKFLPAHVLLAHTRKRKVESRGGGTETWSRASGCHFKSVRPNIGNPAGRSDKKRLPSVNQSFSKRVDFHFTSL